MFDTLITGGTVVNADREDRADVAIAQGRIAALLRPGEDAPARLRIDAAGHHLLPGLVDAHAHLREPGLTHKEDFESGTAAAALGGVTTVLDMPTDEPWTATAAQLAKKRQISDGRINVDVGFQAVLSKDAVDLGALLALGPVSLELFTADVPPAYLFDDLDGVTEQLRRLHGRRTVVGISPGDQSILQGRAARRTDGTIDAFLASRPARAEASGIARALVAASGSDVQIHIRQTNSAAGLAVWRRLRDIADATIETTPQNFFFTAEDYATSGAGLKGSPPFRERADVEALRAALAEGVIDIVATDHAPHSPAEKAANYTSFAEIPGGMPGLQTLLPAMLRLVEDGVIGLRDLVRVCSTAPAARFGLRHAAGAIAVGLPANLVIIDRSARSTILASEQASRAGYTPFHGWSVPARITHVFLRGDLIVRDGALVAPAGGRIVSPCDGERPCF